MKKGTFNLLLFAIVMIFGCTNLPMKNDPNFSSQIDQPQFEKKDGPLVMVDGGHNNFFVMTGLIKPLLDLLTNDGYRIEIGEIEFISRKYLNNKNIVIIPNKIDNTTMLTAFIESKKIDTKLYIDYLRSKLPSYMIPSKVKLLEKLPLNSNDKTDKIALKKMLND